MYEQVQLGFWDGAGIIGYLVLLLGMGFYFKKYSEKGIENYFLAGRNLPGWMNGFSAAATAMNADVAPTYCGMAVVSGVFIYWFFISRFGLALMIAAVLFAVFWHKLGLFTSPEFYEIRFSGKIATTMRSWIAFRSAFISIVAWTGAGLLGLHKILKPTLGWSQLTTFGIVIPVVIIYVFLSGYVGVVFSDVIQTIIILISYIILCGAVLIDFNGPSGLFNALVETHGQSVVQWHPPMHHELLGLTGIIAWTIGTAIGYGGDAAPMGGAMEGQRIFSSKSRREASKMYIWALIILMALLTFLTLPALGAMVRWPGLYTGEVNKETAFGLLIAHYMPPGILWLAIAGLAASIMSTIDSNLNFGSQVFVNDIYKRFIKSDKSDQHYLFVGRIVIFVIMLLALFVALRAKNVIDIAIFMLGISSAELTANWAQWWWWRFNAKARITASFGGPLIFILVKFIFFANLSAYWHVLISIGLTTVAWVTVALATSPDNEELLIKFYKRILPLGRWKPIADKAEVEKINPVSIWKGLGIALLGMLAISSGAILISQLYIGRWSLVKLLIPIVIILSVFAIKFYRAYMDKLEHRLK